MSYIPVFEPATPTEAYQMFLEAVILSKKYQMPVIFRLTTHVCHAKEVIKFGPIVEKQNKFVPSFDRKNGPYLPITRAVFPLKKNAIDRLGKMEKESENSIYNKVHSPFGLEQINGKKLGIISSSMPVLSIQENLDKAKKPVDLLQLNFSFPLPKEKVTDYLKNHDEVIIIEELDRVMEYEIKSLAFDRNIKCKILSRTDEEDLMGELGTERTWKKIGRAHV